MSVGASLCFSCRHLDLTSEAPVTCAAYPNGIPDDIFEGLVDHRRPQPGDRGIRWAQAPDAPPADQDHYDEVLPPRAKARERDPVAPRRRRET